MKLFQKYGDRDMCVRDRQAELRAIEKRALAARKRHLAGLAKHKRQMKARKQELASDPVLATIYKAIETSSTREISNTFALAKRTRDKIRKLLPVEELNNQLIHFIENCSG